MQQVVLFVITNFCIDHPNSQQLLFFAILDLLHSRLLPIVSRPQISFFSIRYKLNSWHIKVWLSNDHVSTIEYSMTLFFFCIQNTQCICMISYLEKLYILHISHIYSDGRQRSLIQKRQMLCYRCMKRVVLSDWYPAKY